jgi:prepilin-type N-terminal cleavage/methylation domain-containing protein
MTFSFHNRFRAMTLIEMIVAMAILSIVMAAIVPQIYCVQNSWAHNQSSSEILQNGRVLIDHITANLSQARRITAVSASTVDNGFIEYLDSDGNILRYSISPAGYVEFGPVGSLSILAGPAAKLRFSCYDLSSLATPTADTNKIRLVNVEAVFSDTANPQTTKSFEAKIMIRANARAGQNGIHP